MLNLIKRLAKSEDGNFAVMAAFGTLTFLGATGLTVDTISSQNLKSQLQAQLDAATIQAAYADPSQFGRITDAIFQENPDLSGLLEQTASLVRSGDVITGQASAKHETFFGEILGMDTVTLSVTSETLLQAGENGFFLQDAFQDAGLGRACIVSTGTGDALRLNSNASLTATGCEIHLHSQSQSPVTFNSGVNLDVEKLCIAGSNFGINNGNLGSDLFETNCNVSPNPYENAFPPIAPSPCDYTNFKPQSLGPQDSRQSFSPGTYCGGINFNSNTGVYNFEPGLYVVRNGTWNINSNVTFNGNGVTFYFCLLYTSPSPRDRG